MNTLTNEYPNIQYILISTNYNTTACRWSMATSMGHFRLLGALNGEVQTTETREEVACMYTYLLLLLKELLPERFS